MSAADLLTAPLHRFADWPNPDVPNWRAGTYAIWRGDEFIYVGMSGRSLAENAHLEPDALVSKAMKGLRERLNTHASGRRSGDQFSVYLCDRMILPMLSQEEIKQVKDGELLLDTVTRDFVRRELSYRYLVMPDGARAKALEDEIKRHGINGARPFLNPS